MHFYKSWLLGILETINLLIISWTPISRVVNGFLNKSSEHLGGARGQRTIADTKATATQINHL